MSASRTASFGAACAACPLRERCTTAKGGRSMTIHPHEGLLRAAHAQARTEQFKRACPTRSAIERIIAWTATQNGRRVKLRYTGTAKTTPGCTPGAPRSTCAPCCGAAWRVAVAPGSWPERPGTRPPGPASSPGRCPQVLKSRPSLLKTGGPGKHEQVPGALPDQAAGRPSANPGCSGGS